MNLIKSPEIINVYLNEKQLEFLDAPQKFKFALCSRAFGKSHLMGEQGIDFIAALPGGKGALIGMTYSHLKNKTLTAMETAWRKGWGLREYDKTTGIGEYVKFTKPPRAWIDEMIEPPNDWSTIISFPNGFHFELVSMASIEKHRGSSFDCAMIDEVAKLPQDAFDEVISQFIRGNIYVWESHLHQAVCMFTTIPWLPSQQWIYRFEELAKNEPEEYYWLEGNVWDNELILGKKWILRQKKILPPLKFAVELENKRITKIPDGFYYAFEEKRNTISELDLKRYYGSFGLEYGMVENLINLVNSTDETNYQLAKQIVMGIGAEWKFWDNERPLDASFDFNASLNTCTILQENQAGDRVRAHKGFFVQNESYLELVRQITEHYHFHKTKTIYIYGDRNANKTDAENNPTFFQKIVTEFANKGWTAILMSEGGVEQLHHLRYDVSNTIMSGKNLDVPLLEIHQDANKYLIISIQSTPAKDGFKKDKSSERETDEELRRRATDWGDGLDYYLYDKYASLLGHSNYNMPFVFIEL